MASCESRLVKRYASTPPRSQFFGNWNRNRAPAREEGSKRGNEARRPSSLVVLPKREKCKLADVCSIFLLLSRRRRRARIVRLHLYNEAVGWLSPFPRNPRPLPKYAAWRSCIYPTTNKTVSPRQQAKMARVNKNIIKVLIIFERNDL